MLITIISLLLLLACSSVQGIQGGDNATAGEVAWAVSLQRVHNSHPFCGGAILTRDLVITAAHCLEQLKSLHDIRITTGNMRSRPRSIHNVTWIRKHENYKNIGYAIFNDVALLQVKPRFKFDRFVTDVNLPERNFRVSSGTRALMAGWGVSTPKIQTKKDTKNPDTLQKLTMTMISEKECNNKYKGRWIDIKSQNLCSTSNGLSGTCMGDSGGPLVIGRKTLVGITSWVHQGQEKCSELPTVYANISYFLDWILENMVA